MIAARVPQIARVPRPILNQLIERFETAHKTGETFTSHADWLKEKGYPIARSLVHKFCQKLRSLKAANPNQDVLDVYLNQIEQSKRCL